VNEKQTYEENKTEFITRLVEAGWSKEEAEQAWEAIQEE